MSSPFLLLLENQIFIGMPQKKKASVYRTNLVNVGIGQGQMKTLPYLFSVTEFTGKGETLSQSSYTSGGLLTEKIAWEYDEKGRVIRQYYYSEEDTPSETTSFERDAKGDVVKELKVYIDGSTDTTTYRYDKDKKLLEKVTVDDEDVTDRHERFTWDDHLLIRHEIIDMEEHPIELDEFKYDEAGNLVEHKRINEETGENYRIVSEYNKSGQKIADLIYDEEDELVEKVCYEHDDHGKVISSIVESPQKNSNTRYFYDEKGNHLGHEEVDDEGTQLVWVEHAYDQENNLTSSTVFVNGRGSGMSQHYELQYEYEWYDEEDNPMAG